MDERTLLSKKLRQLDQNIQKLKTLYEQYFAGVEKREPINLRDQVQRDLRAFHSTHIVHTDLRFQLQALVSRFSSYCGYWDRIVRQIDEGTYFRHRRNIDSTSSRKVAVAKKMDENGRLYNELLAVHKEQGGKVPSRESFDNFLEKQRRAIREKYGDRKLEFFIVADKGRPRLKVKSAK